MEDPRFYYACVVNNATRDRGTGWIWSVPFATPREAKEALARRYAEGTVNFGVVACAIGGKRTVLRGYILPSAARKAVEQYLDLLGLCEED